MSAAYVARANAAMRQGDYAVALRHLERAQRARPALAHVYAAGVALAKRRLLAGVGGALAQDRVDVVVPVYNALACVQRCLAALAQHAAGTDLRVLVVNDGSDAETTQWLRRYCQGPMWQLIEHSTNRGYTPAINTGLRASSAPFVVTLNSDTEVTQGWLQGLLACMAHHPKVGLVGPLSNAASWQNVPRLLNEAGKFATNDLPQGMAPGDMAAVVEAVSLVTYPRVPFLNGFCCMIRREVLEAVGLLDEAHFPIGYGEENDLCIRAADAGFELAVADDVFVFHAKTQSFGNEQRQALQAQGQANLERKHGRERVAALVAAVKQVQPLHEMRQRLGLVLERVAAVQPVLAGQLRVLFLLPVAGGSGGAHSVVQEAAALRHAGKVAHVAVEQGRLQAYRQLYADVKGADALFVGFTALNLVDVAARFDVVVATVWNSVAWLERLVAAHPHVLPAYYVQDYEPLFYPEGSPERAEAAASYTQLPGAVLFAKTRWLQEVVQTHHPDVTVHKVLPSLDHQVYYPRPRAPRQGLRVVAMVRPKTPRRGAERTVRLFGRLQQVLGPAVPWHVFGADAALPDMQALANQAAMTQHGVLRRPQVAELLASCDVFVDLSDYQAFGRTALEAMACGCMPVVPRRGGCDEFAQHGVNAWVVNTDDEQACFDGLLELLTQPARVAQMQQAGLETAARYSTLSAALSEYALLEQHAQEWRAKQRQLMLGGLC